MTSVAVQRPGNIQGPLADTINVIRCGTCGRWGLAGDQTCVFCKQPLIGPWATIDTSGDTWQIVGPAPGFLPAYAERWEVSGKPVFEREGTITAMDVLQTGPVDLIEQNRNWQCLICGPPGTGKTYSGIRIAEMLDRKFDSDKIVFDTLSLIQMLRSVGPGEFIVYDEAEAFNARQSMKTENVELSKIISMIRFTRINIIYCLPHMKMIDINARRVILNYLHTIPFNRKRAPLWMRNKSGVYWYNVNMPRVPMPGNENMEPTFSAPWVKGEQVSKVWFLKANETILEEYERAKSKLWHYTLDSAEATIRASRAKEAKEGGGGKGQPQVRTEPPPIGSAREIRQKEILTDKLTEEILDGGR